MSGRKRKPIVHDRARAQRMIDGAEHQSVSVDYCIENSESEIVRIAAFAVAEEYEVAACELAAALRIAVDFSPKARIEDAAGAEEVARLFDRAAQYYRVVGKYHVRANREVERARKLRMRAKIPEACTCEDRAIYGQRVAPCPLHSVGA